MNKQETLKILLTIAAAYQNSFTASVEVVELWRTHMKNIPFELAQGRLHKHITSDRYPPTIADIVSHSPKASSTLVRGLLRVCREIGTITKGMETVGIIPDSINRVHDQITDIIWSLYNITLTSDQCNDNFMTVIIDYSNGEFEIDECLDYLAQFAASAG